MRKNSDLLNSIHARRLSFCKQNKEKDCVVLEGKNNILISSPHGVSQVRLGRYKVAEIGSLAVALFLKDNTNCWLIAKTKNNNDDANFDTVCNYKNELKKLVLTNNIKYVLDIHGLAEKRECDVNLGIHLGQHIQTDVKLFEKLKNSLTKKRFCCLG